MAIPQEEFVVFEAPIYAAANRSAMNSMNARTVAVCQREVVTACTPSLGATQSANTGTARRQLS